MELILLPLLVMGRVNELLRSREEEEFFSDVPGKKVCVRERGKSRPPRGGGTVL